MLHLLCTNVCQGLPKQGHTHLHLSSPCRSSCVSVAVSGGQGSDATGCIHAPKPTHVTGQIPHPSAKEQRSPHTIRSPGSKLVPTLYSTCAPNPSPRAQEQPTTQGPPVAADLPRKPRGKQGARAHNPWRTRPGPKADMGCRNLCAHCTVCAHRQTRQRGAACRQQPDSNGCYSTQDRCLSRMHHSQKACLPAQRR